MTSEYIERVRKKNGVMTYICVCVLSNSEIDSYASIDVCVSFNTDKLSGTIAGGAVAQTSRSKYPVRCFRFAIVQQTKKKFQTPEFRRDDEDQMFSNIRHERFKSSIKC